MPDLFSVVKLEEKVTFDMLVIGASGRGKTSFACTPQHPGLLPALLVDIDHGLASIARPEGWPGITILDAADMNSLPKLPLILKTPDTNPQKPAWAKGVKTVILDSLSAFGEEATLLLAQGPDSDTNSPFQAGQRDYLIAQNMMLSTVNNLKAAGVNVIALAGATTKEGMGGADLSPGVKKKLQYKWSYVWRVKIIQTADGRSLHVVETLPKDDKDELKTRHSRFRETLVAESLPRLKAAGLLPNPANAGIFVLKNPMSDKHQDYEVDLGWFYQKFVEATS